MNICRIRQESDIDYIINTYSDKLIVIIFVEDVPEMKKFCKRVLAAQFPDCYFVIAIDDNKSLIKRDLNNKYFNKFSKSEYPFVLFYENKNPVEGLMRASSREIYTVTRKLIDIIRNKPKFDDVETKKIKKANEQVVLKMEQEKELHQLEEFEKKQLRESEKKSSTVK